MKKHNGFDRRANPVLGAVWRYNREGLTKGEYTVIGYDDSTDEAVLRTPSGATGRVTRQTLGDYRSADWTLESVPLKEVDPIYKKTGLDEKGNPLQGSLWVLNDRDHKSSINLVVRDVYPEAGICQMENGTTHSIHEMKTMVKYELLAMANTSASGSFKGAAKSYKDLTKMAVDSQMAVMGADSSFDSYMGRIAEWMNKHTHYGRPGPTSPPQTTELATQQGGKTEKTRKFAEVYGMSPLKMKQLDDPTPRFELDPDGDLKPAWKALNYPIQADYADLELRWASAATGIPRHYLFSPTGRYRPLALPPRHHLNRMYEGYDMHKDSTIGWVLDSILRLGEEMNLKKETESVVDKFHGYCKKDAEVCTKAAESDRLQGLTATQAALDEAGSIPASEAGRLIAEKYGFPKLRIDDSKNPCVELAASPEAKARIDESMKKLPDGPFKFPVEIKTGETWAIDTETVEGKARDWPKSELNIIMAKTRKPETVKVYDENGEILERQLGKTFFFSMEMEGMVARSKSQELMVQGSDQEKELQVVFQADYVNDTRHEVAEDEANKCERQGKLAEAKKWRQQAALHMARDKAVDLEVKAIMEKRYISKDKLEKMGAGERKSLEMKGLKEFKEMAGPDHPKHLWWA